MLCSAACHPLYPTLAGAAARRAAGSSTSAAACFRHEPSADPARMQAFRQHEFVYVGDAGRRARAPGPLAASAALDAARRAGPDGRDARWPTTRSSAGPAGCWRPTSASRRARSSRSWRRSTPTETPDGDRLVQLPPGPLRRAVRHPAPPTAGRRTPRASGFGLERITLALLRTHGLDPAPWPAGVARAGCGRDTRAAGSPLEPPRRYRPHALHAQRREPGRETNCYVDVWIELLHALGLDPLAALRLHARRRLRGRPVDVLQAAARGPRALYGIEVHEMNVWRPRRRPRRRAARLGRLLTVEVDAWFLPDTAGRRPTSCEHIKTTIVANEIDPEARRLGYFHNAGYFEAEGEDFDGVFRVGRPRRGPAARCPTSSWSPSTSCAATTRPTRRARPDLPRAPGRRPDDNPVHRRAHAWPTTAPGWPPARRPSTPTPSSPAGSAGPRPRWPARSSSGSPTSTRRPHRRCGPRPSTGRPSPPGRSRCS